MIYKTKEEKEQALSEATLTEGMWDLEYTQNSKWGPIKVGHDLGVIVKDGAFHIRKVEPKKITAFDLAGMWIKGPEWACIQIVGSIAEDGATACINREWLSLGRLSDHIFSKDPKEPLSEWKTIKQMEAEL